eukprot:TRINITY_DN16242_c0_g1_i1.p1 TRINITY_DN16242_c0_g1~~TRINITY_DN16242_c0_g1_i1.p1  ORF type:complete len:612 (+),score=137.39 TRINITY_DN16242_c0_g1_i1:44-1837(+)
MNLLKQAQAAAGVNLGTPVLQKQSESKAKKEAAELREKAVLKYRAPVQMKDENGVSLKLEGGEKMVYSEEEAREFAGGEYGNGMTVAVYEGEVRDVDKRDGYGRYTYPKGEVFEGRWRMNKRHGDGILSMTTGHRYEGGWKDDSMDGKGREEFVKGEVYAGDYSKGRMNGKGVLDYYTTGSVFEGEYQDGRKHGKGRVLYSNGDVFEGTWVHGRREGKGTTTYANGRVYKSEWVAGRLKGDLVYDKTTSSIPRTGPVRDKRLKLNKASLIPVTLDTFTPKSDIKEISVEQFMRIQIAFEDMDTQAVGAIPYTALEAGWKGDKALLNKLNRDKSGSVDLYGVYRAWYPMVPRRDVEKYLSTYITPLEVLKHRGELNGVSGGKGFVHLADGREELELETLVNTKFLVGGEVFSEGCFRKACARTDKTTVSFTDMLDVWYPNTPYLAILRYSLPFLPEDDLPSITADFNALQDEGVLVIDDFDAAQQRYQTHLASGSTASFTSLPTTPQDAIHTRLLPGPFKGEPIWHLGPITLSIKMLHSIDARKGGWVTLTDLLCFNYPNIDCVWTKHRFLERPVNPVECSCDIHAFTEDSVIEQLGS